VALEERVDRALIASGAVVATADGAVLDGAAAWVDLVDAVRAQASAPWLVDLRDV
jgi:hypothetical protein